MVNRNRKHTVELNLEVTGTLESDAQRTLNAIIRLIETMYPDSVRVTSAYAVTERNLLTED